ncbi:Broad-specificity phosphatase [Spathaspora sp. JA1]|nr:Broad-specificity phosphatase [Spathaspora sp. JA1]
MTREITVNNDSNITRVFILRHGQTDHNVNKILQGHLDTDLNTTGKQQAETVAKYLSQFPIDYVVSSDLSRCKDTLEPVLVNQMNIQGVRYTSNLRERDMGNCEGMYLKDALAQYGPGFRNLGEKEEELCARVELEWNRISKLTHKNVLICTHGGVITRFTNYLYSNLKYDLDESLTVQDLKVPFNTSITIIDINKETKTGKIQQFGNTVHLGGNFEVKEQLLR